LIVSPTSVSISAPGQPFHSPAADEALFSSLKKNLRADIPIIEHDTAINAPSFARARACAEALLAHLEARRV